MAVVLSTKEADHIYIFILSVTENCVMFQGTDLIPPEKYVGMTQISGLQV